MHVDMTSTPVERFREFYQGYQDENGKHIYVEQVQKMSLEGLTSIILNYDDLLRYDPELARLLRENPEETIKSADDALVEVLRVEDPIYASSGEVFHARFISIPDLVDLRRLRSVHLGQFISVEGIIIRQSVVKPLLVQGVFQCAICGEVHYINQEDGIYAEPTRCANPNCGKKGPFKLLTEESTYTDLQTVTVQEKPEELPPGQIPRSLPSRLVGDLVDSVRAGDRAIASGILKMRPSRTTQGKTKTATFDPWLDVNYISSKDKEYEDIEIDPETEEEIIKLSKDLNVHRRIVRSIAPSIYGMETIKEALASVLFGGVSRVAPDGMKQRGDSNVLLVGDPGVAKSQMLQYIARLAPRGLLTSGKASSAAGLTAAVVRDPDSGEFTLEAGALVLADRGVCLIDEFDKMNPVDRSSIHEAMEQHSYHPNFELSLLNGRRENIGPFVDELFNQYNELKIMGNNCEILPINHLKIKTLTTDFNNIFETNINRVSRHIAPNHFYRITYSNGREIVVTPEHPIFLHENGDIRERDANMIKKGDIVPGVRHLLQKNSSSLSIDFNRGRKEIVLPVSITEDLAKFLGYYISEGYSYSGSSQEVGLSNTNPEIIESMIECIENTFGITPLNYVKENRTLRIISRDIYDYLIENFNDMMKKSYEKRINKKIFCISKEKRTVFLKAAFEGDGSIESTSMAYSTASRGLAYDYQDLLLTLEIHSRIHKDLYHYGEEGKHQRYRYKVYITGDSLSSFYNLVLEKPKDNKKLLRMVEKSRSGRRSHDILPPSIAPDIIESLHNLGLSYSGYFHQHLSGNYGITVYKINEYLVVLSNRKKNIEDKINNFNNPQRLREFVNYSKMRMAPLVGISRNTLAKYEKLNQSNIKNRELLEAYKNTLYRNLEKVQTVIDRINNLKKFRWLRVKKVERIDNVGEFKTDWVYDVTIEPTENFISHGVMLHNTISIAKAGIVATLNARTSIIAAANPRFGRYEDTRPPNENINLPPTILSRFDLIFVIKDLPDEEKDKKMARHILELRRGHITEAVEPVISMDLLRKYISYAKQQVEPALTDEAMERIETYYLDLRKTSDDSAAIAITPRYLEAIIRLSESQARMALKDEVTIDHVEAAINLLRTSLEQVGKDPVTGKVDIDFLLSGTTKATRSKMQTVIDLIKEESRKGTVDIVPVRKIKDLAKENNIEEDFVDKVIEQLRSNGEIYSPRDGYVKLA
ncbi:MAG: LAGLIDADG family homing endonuclease [Candidatus Heimdallarchaeaceae archaeon]